MTLPSSSLAPTSSPGEVGAPVVFAGLTGLLSAFGVDPVKASSIAGFAGVVTPYVVKGIIWLTNRRKKSD
jgi:hypothetical protein